jgi:hypothetical protein
VHRPSPVWATDREATADLRASDLPGANTLLDRPPCGAGVEGGDIAYAGLRSRSSLDFTDGSTGRSRVSGRFARLMTLAGAHPGSANEVQ